MLGHYLYIGNIDVRINVEVISPQFDPYQHIFTFSKRYFDYSRDFIIHQVFQMSSMNSYVYYFGKNQVQNIQDHATKFHVT